MSESIDTAPGATAVAEPTGAAAPAGNRRRVLVADDSRLTLFILSKSLEREGYEVVQATTGTEALEALSRPDAPRLAILDWFMPGIEGVEICRRVREGFGGNAYLILLTSNEDRSSVLKGLHAGADDYLTKPWDEDVLKARINVGWRILDLQSRLSDNVRRLEESNVELTQLASIVETSGDAIVGVSVGGRITSWNRGAETMLGLSAESAVGRRLVDAVGPEAGEVAARVRRAVRRGGDLTGFEMTLARPDGSTAHVSLSISLLHDPEGRVTGAAAIGRDITARRSMEAQLRQAQKMESIGQLAAGVAHEINTPVQYVSDNTRFLLDAFGELKCVLDAYRDALSAAPEDAVPAPQAKAVADAEDRYDVEFLADEVPRAIEQSLEGTDRIVKIVQSMKDFAHPGGAGRQAANLNKAIESTITVARNEWKYVADMDLRLDPALPLVPCVIGDFNQVVLNLVVNAAHAIGDVVRTAGGKGLITIATRVEDDLAIVEVTDTGGGIPEAARPRVFDPFFTTKEVGKGTGQGLAISYSIVERHGGTISFTSELGHGTTFTVALPLSV